MPKNSKRLWAEVPFKSSFDAVIIGGGIHGLATAYFLAKDHGMTDVAVIERRYVGFWRFGPEHGYSAGQPADP